MSIVVDCTTSPSVAALRADGVTGVCRYLSWLYRYGGSSSHTTPNPKIITKAEMARLIAGRISVALNWEFDDHDWMGGGSAGASHAAEAVRQARVLGYPAGRVIVGSADFDMTASQWASAGRAYAAAFAARIRTGGYLPGVYGPWDVLEWCQDLGGFGVYWQAGMSTAWSGKRNANRWPGAHLRQIRHQSIGGIDCDVNEILKTAYGQFTGDDMLDAATQKRLDDAYWQATNAVDIETGHRVPVSGATSLLVTHVRALEAGLLALQKSVHQGQPLTDDQLATVMAQARDAAQAEVQAALQVAADAAGQALDG